MGTWRYYGEGIEAYQGKPTRRVFIPKADGRQRPFGVMALEDKIVQRATTTVLNAICESDFLGFSYVFRPGRPLCRTTYEKGELSA
jgi:RNA-directed DNA polymerase